MLPSTSTRWTRATNMPKTQGSRWFIVRTASRREKILAGQLAARDVQCFLPTVPCTRLYGGVEAHVTLPLFPGQLFVYGTDADARTAATTPHVMGVSPGDDEQRLDDDLRNIQRALAITDALKPCARPQHAQVVEVSAGPLEGLRGLVDPSQNPKQLILPVNGVEQAVCTMVNGSVIQAVC
jgi:transcription antitermination factor NusG